MLNLAGIRFADPHAVVTSPNTVITIETDRRLWPPRRGWFARALVVAALLMFAAPLFIGLGRWDMRNDEAIYSYAVERILESHRWLTPESIPTHEPFLEKPPLKFWIVAAGMKAGLVPRNEYGLRFFDALFGAAAFAYIFAIGWRLIGPVAGFVALLVLFTFDPIIFEHGFRSNNMEAALVLAYAGGMFHFSRWVEGTNRRLARWHAAAVAAYFVLGFMTKFVAAIFLPAAAGLAYLWRPGVLADLRARWTDWILPIVGALGAIAPWFIYQSQVNDTIFWETILGEHIYRRFTASLDPSHLHPWHYYFTQAWLEFSYATTLFIVFGGLVVLVWFALRGRPWLARLIFLWWLVPCAMISLGTSKLFHYAYPFIPPLALGAGLLVSLCLQWMDEYIARALAHVVNYLAIYRRVSRRPNLRAGLIAVAAVLLALSAWTYVTGEPFTVMVGDVRVFRNSSVWRPLILAAPLLCLVGYARGTMRGLAVLAIIPLLPWGTYGQKFERLSSIDHPLNAMRDCMKALAVEGLTRRPGVFVSDSTIVAHPYYYYFRSTGPWTISSNDDELERESRVRLFEPGAQTPVIMTPGERRRLRQRWDEENAQHPDQPYLDMNSIALVGPQPTVAILLPGPFHACVGPVRLAGGNVSIPSADVAP